jgi:uncharacterized protein YciI
MYYSIVGEDVADSGKWRAQHRSAHIERLQQLVAEGRLLVAGPNPAVDSAEPGAAGFTGSVVIAEFASLEAAQAWADKDPYLMGGVYREVVVKPYKAVLP